MNNEAINKALITVEKLVEEVGYKEFVMALMKWERDIPLEDLEIDFTTWWEVGEGYPSILNSYLAGEEVETY